MATPQQESLQELIGIQHELIRNSDLINEQVRYAGKLGGQFLEARKIAEQLNSSLRGSVDIQSDINKSFFTTLQVTKSIQNLVKQQERITETRKKVIDTLTVSEKAGLAVYRDQVTENEKINKEIEIQKTLLADVNVTAQNRVQAKKELVKLEKQEFKTSQEINNSLKNRKIAEIAMYDISEKSVDQAVKINKEIQKRIRFTDNLVGKIQDLGQRVSKTDLGKGLMAGLGIASGAIMFKTLIESAFKLNSSLTSISKNSGTTAEFSDQIASNYLKTQNNVHLLNNNLNTSLLTLSGMLESQQDLQASSGQMSLYTEKSVQDQMFLTKQMGMQVDEATSLQKVSLLNSTTSEEALNNIYKQVAASNKITGFRTSGLEMAKAVAKVEGLLAVNYKNNVVSLAAAVTQAKSLGISLEQAAAASNSLLDFESSISNELEAELLTGKQWNLEKARSLALDGKSAEAAAEMLKNIGGIHEFEKMNVITKQAAARAVGMTADELSNALRTTELMKKVSQETKTAIQQSGEASKYNAQLNAATNATEMLAAEKRVSNQIEYEKSMEKVRDAIGQMASGPMLALVDFMKVLTDNSMVLKGIIALTAGLMAAMAASSIVTAVAMTVASGGTNLAGAAIGISALGAAGLTAYALNAKPMGDGLISPSGQTLISTPEGMIKPSKNDYIGLATDPKTLFGGGGGSGKSEQLLSAILQAVQQPGGVFIDGQKAGTALGMGYSSYA